MPTHTRLSLQPKSREPRKTAGGIRGQRKAGVRRQTAVTAMPLKMRPTGLGSGIDKDRADYTVFTGEWEVGRIYETRGGPDNLRWFWSMTVNGPMTRSDRVATLGCRQGKHIHGMKHGSEAAKRQKLCVINR
jgi:hypothetical protein